VDRIIVGERTIYIYIPGISLLLMGCISIIIVESNGGMDTLYATLVFQMYCMA
jgi:uncharacterized membrane protein (GlpM family)